MDTNNSDNPPVSDAKLRANRANSKHSTGPKTDQGKEHSSRNSFKHGLTGQIHIATIEEMAVYQAFCQEYFDEWKPLGPTEKGMVQTLADTQWQIHRATTLINNIHPDDDGELSAEQSQQLDRYSRHAGRFKRDFERTLKLLTEHQKARKSRDLHQLIQASRIHDMHKMLREDWEPPRVGFDLTIQEIEKYMLRRNMLLDADTAMLVDYDIVQFNKKWRSTSSEPRRKQAACPRCYAEC